MNLRSLVVVLVLGVALGFWFSSSSFSGFATLAPQTVSLQENQLQVFFCPADHCDEQLIRRIEGAQESVDIAIYSFTLDSIGDALIEKHRAGVPVRVLFDNSQAAGQASEDERLEAAGVPIKRMDLSRGIMHNKYIIIDHRVVGTGSYNYSQNASSYNRENLVFVSVSSVAERFGTDFERLWNAS